MRVGITYDLRSPGAGGPVDGAPAPDDAQEEYDSPATIEAIADVLRGLGHAVEKLGDGRELLERLLADPPAFVFNVAEGQGVGRAREARVPAVLEMLGIPYSGSDPLTLAVTLDKDCAKRLVASANVAVPAGILIRPGDDVRRATAGQCPFPAILKPAWEGSSKGIRGHCLVDRAEDLPPVVESLWRDHRQPVLIEEYVAGEELTVGIVGNGSPQVVGVMGVVPTDPTDRFVYSLEVKRDYLRRVHYQVPPPLPAATLAAVTRAALDAYAVLGCRDVSRVDFRLRDGVPYFLEVNPLPGLNPESSDLVILAKASGWTYGRLIEAILHAALERQPVPLAETSAAHPR